MQTFSNESPLNKAKAVWAMTRRGLWLPLLAVCGLVMVVTQTTAAPVLGAQGNEEQEEEKSVCSKESKAFLGKGGRHCEV